MIWDYKSMNNCGVSSSEIVRVEDSDTFEPLDDQMEENVEVLHLCGESIRTGK